MAGQFFFGHICLRSRDNLHPFPLPFDTFNQTWLCGGQGFPIQPASVPDQSLLSRPEGSEVLQAPGASPLSEDENIESHSNFTEQCAWTLYRNTKPNLENGHESVTEAREQIRPPLLKLTKPEKEDARLQGLWGSEDLSAGSVSDTKDQDDLHRLLNLLLRKQVEGDIPLQSLAEFVRQDIAVIKDCVERYAASLPRETLVITMPIWLGPVPDETMEG